MRVIGIDPGLTRCGVGVVDGDSARRVSLVETDVIRSDPSLPLEQRLMIVFDGVLRFINRHDPDRMAIERVFSQKNVRTAMGTSQASAVVMLAGARAGIPVTTHTPSEVKAAVTGNGRAEKQQVGLMVQRVLKLTAIPKPADSADALALAICHVWRAPLSERMATAANLGKGSLK